MGQGVAITNQSTENAELPWPLQGMLNPGQTIAVNATPAMLTNFGISNGGTLRVVDLTAAYVGPYDAAFQGSLNSDGSVTSQTTLPDFGDASDGDIVFDGVTTPVAGATLAGSTYTFTRNVYAKNATINAAVRVKQAGFLFECSETCTVAATGQLDVDGADGAAGVAGAAATAQVYGGSFAGGAGGTAGGAGAGGTNATTTGGGAGGAGGAATAGGAGGAGGTATAPTAAQGGIPRTAIFALLGQVLGNAGLTLVKGGGGGGGGGADGANVGGGGGGGAAYGCLAAAKVVNNGRISARGGAGAAGTAGNAGGGGGAGGGYYAIITRSYSGSGTFDANGGAGGAKSGTGTAGTAGSAGNAIKIAA